MSEQRHYYERPQGERLAVLETDMAHVKSTVNEIAGMVRDMHRKQVGGSAVISFVSRGLHMGALAFSGMAGFFAHKIWG